MNMTPQLIYLVLVFISLGMIIEEGDTSSIITSLITYAITLSLLCWGGFFDVFFI